jgi:hypothetical protein
VDARDLEDGGEVVEIRVPDQRGKGAVADEALTEVCVAVAVGSEVHLGVVEMKAAEAVEANGARDFVHHGIGLPGCRVVDPGGPQVLGIEAHADPRIAAGGVDDLGQFVKGAADGAAGPRGVLEEEVADRTVGALGSVQSALRDLRDPPGRRDGVNPAMAPGCSTRPKAPSEVAASRLAISASCDRSRVIGSGLTTLMRYGAWQTVALTTGLFSAASR